MIRRLRLLWRNPIKQSSPYYTGILFLRLVPFRYTADGSLLFFRLGEDLFSGLKIVILSDIIAYLDSSFEIMKKCHGK